MDGAFALTSRGTFLVAPPVHFTTRWHSRHGLTALALLPARTAHVLVCLVRELRRASQLTASFVLEDLMGSLHMLEGKEEVDVWIFFMRKSQEDVWIGVANSCWAGCQDSWAV